MLGPSQGTAMAAELREGEGSAFPPQQPPGTLGTAGYGECSVDTTHLT